MSLFHVSVGFVNLRTGLNSTFEFTADSFNPDLLFPDLNFTARSMVWKNNAAGLHAKEGELDLEYWQFRTRVAIIDGAAYNAFLSWAHVAADRVFTRYMLFNFAVAGSDRPQFYGFTCFDGAEAMLHSIAKLAGPCVFDRTVPGIVRNDITTWGSSEAMPVDNTSSPMAFNYYAAIEKITDLRRRGGGISLPIVAEIFRLVGVVRSGQAVFHDSSDRYWSYKPAKPFISAKTVVAPLPGVCEDEAAKAVLV